jgi:hypothetical protein
MRVDVDASVKRESFPNRQLSPSESAAALALFHVAMNRPVEARAAIDEARKAGPLPTVSWQRRCCWSEKEKAKRRAPGTRDRKPVPVEVEMEMNFALR